jgi:hypothetical protein
MRNPHRILSRVRLLLFRNFASFGSDDIAFTLDLHTQQASSRTLLNEEREEVTALAMDPRNPANFIVGTAAGCVKALLPAHDFSLLKA